MPGCSSYTKLRHIIPCDAVLKLLDQERNVGSDLSSGVPLQCLTCGIILTAWADMQRHSAGCGAHT